MLIEKNVTSIKKTQAYKDISLVVIKKEQVLFHDTK